MSKRVRIENDVERDCIVASMFDSEAKRIDRLTAFYHLYKKEVGDRLKISNKNINWKDVRLVTDEMFETKYGKT